MPDSRMSELVGFGPFELDLATAELHSGGRKIRVPEQQFKILVMLLLAEGNLVSREEIRKRLWPNDTVVEFDRSINAAIKKLRAALEDSAEAPRFIETVARRGYRILVAVHFPEAAPAPRCGQENRGWLPGRPESVTLPRTDFAGRRRNGAGLQGGGSEAQPPGSLEVSSRGTGGRFAGHSTI